jgi:diketogulonate reductase-like aldo/keto reductase
VVPNLHEGFVLANGVTVPQIGFGTWLLEDARAAVSAALRIGYRHVDTARSYRNEAAVGRAVSDSGLGRADVFVTSKLPADVKTYDGAMRSFETTSRALRLDPLDLYLVHAPWPWDEKGSDHTAGNAQVWHALEDLYGSGRVRAIGVSNFRVKHLRALARSALVRPHVNQVEFYVGRTRKAIAEYCQEQGILVQAHSPLAQGQLVGHSVVRELAIRYGRTPAQLCIRYVLQKGVLPIPKSADPRRMAENADVDFRICAADMIRLDGLRNTAVRNHRH